MNRQNLIVGGATVLSFATGVVTGYLLCNKRMASKYDKLLAEQIEQTKQFYGRLYKRDEYATPESTYDAMVDEAVEAVRAYKGMPPSKIEDVTEVSEEDGTIDVEYVMSDSELVVVDVQEKNIFDNGIPEQLDVANRSADYPYVVTLEEYMENEQGHEQVTMTYYSGDNVLADERDKHVEDVQGTVGRINLQRFGVGSGDPNVVLIRNEKIGLDFEVLQSTGKYAHEVLGFEEDLKHSDSGHRRGRPRWDDDE